MTGTNPGASSPAWRMFRRLANRGLNLVIPGRAEGQRLKQENVKLMREKVKLERKLGRLEQRSNKTAGQLRKQALRVEYLKKAQEEAAARVNTFKARVNELQAARQEQLDAARRLQQQCEELERIAEFLYSRVRLHGGLESGDDTEARRQSN